MRRLVCLLAVVAFAQEPVLLRNATIHPVTGPEVAAALLIKDGVIAEIGAKIAAPKGLKTLDLKGLHIYPGMIDSATTLGLTEIGSVRETQDTTEIGDYNPQLRAIIAVNPSSEHIPVARANGITAAIVLPDGAVIGGQAGLMHLDGWTWEEMAIARAAALHLKFPVLRTTIPGEFFERPRTVPFKDAKTSHEDALRKLSALFEDARRYARAKGGAGFQPDRKLEAMQPVLEGKLPVMIAAVREREIREALDFAEKEKVRVILAGPRRFGAQLERVKARKVPVILGATMSLPLEEDDAYDAQYSLPGELHRAGVPFAFATFDSSDVRNLPYQAAAAVPFGLPAEEALKAVTIQPAKIWGVDDKIGSVEKGKWADLIVTDGDPLEIRTQVKRMFIRGREVSLESRHTKLYEKFLSRP